MTIMMMLILISNSKLVYSKLDEYCFKECIRGCQGQKNHNYYLVCEKICEDHGQILNYCNLDCSINKFSSLVKDIFFFFSDFSFITIFIIEDLSKTGFYPNNNKDMIYIYLILFRSLLVKLHDCLCMLFLLI